MNARELLTIDVAAELRRLAEATLEGPWQVPAELVRRSVAAGARRIEVSLARDRVSVRDDGRPLPAECQRDLDVLLDAKAPGADRHRALVALEAHTSLLSIAALFPSHVRLTSEPAAGTTITIAGTKLDAAAARDWLRSCARFAPCTVIVDDETVPRGFSGALAEAPLAAPLSGTLALTRADSAHLWLLAHGVVSSHLTLPDTPAFEAAIELGTSASSNTPAALREAVEPHLGPLVDEAVGLMLETLAREGRRGERVGALRSRLLIAARRGWRRADVFAASFIPMVQGPDAAIARYVRIDDLGRDRSVPCLSPKDDRTAYLLPPGPVLVLDEEERGQLAPLLGLRFLPLQRRRVPLGFAARAHALLADVRQSVPRLLARVLHPGAGRPLSHASLDPDERAFLEALAPVLADPRGAGVALTDGAAPPTRHEGRLLLSRRHPDVRAAIRAVARDKASAYVAALALADEETPSAEAARAWRRSLVG